MSDNLELLSSLAESGWADSMTLGSDETADGSPTAVASDVLQWAVGEIARLRLTDAEREALAYFSALTVSPREDDSSQAAVLRGLLERLGGER